MSWGREMCDDFDFHRRALGKGRDLHRRTRWKWLRKIPRIDRVHLREITQIRHEHRRLHHIAKSEALIRQNHLYVLQNAFCLSLNAAAHQGAICRIERDLPAREEKVSDTNRNAIRTDRFGGSLWRNGLWTHTYVDSRAATFGSKIIDSRKICALARRLLGRPVILGIG